MKPVTILSKFALRLILFSAVAAFLHDVLIRYTDLELPRQKLYGLYIILTILSFLVFTVVQWVARKSFDRAGFSFLGASLLKMMAFVIYLMPMLKAGDPANKPVIVQYLAVYLVFLVFEALGVFSLLKKAPSNPPAQEQ